VRIGARRFPTGASHVQFAKRATFQVERRVAFTAPGSQITPLPAITDFSSRATPGHRRRYFLFAQRNFSPCETGNFSRRNS
jgi:hypothetical protein